MAVTNKVPNSTDKSEWQGDYGYGDYWELLLTAKSGYKFDAGYFNDTNENFVVFFIK